LRLREKPFRRPCFLTYFASETKENPLKHTIMKKFITALTVLLTLTASATAMSYSQARERALFLTDKMAYELNLTEEQYEAAYEVNLDYLMSIDTYDDLYGAYWTNRNLDLSYILLDWQYRAFCAASYFYRPLIWDAGVWRFSIYARYPHRSYFYFGRPAFYATYHGGHGWHMNGGHSWYRGRDFGHGHIAQGHGMKDRFDRGDFRGRSFGTTNHGNIGRLNDRGYSRANDNLNSRNNQSNRRFNRNNGNLNRNESGIAGANSRSNGSRMEQGSMQRQRRGSFSGNRTEGRVNRESSTRATVRPQQMSGTSRSQLRTNSGSQRSLPSHPSNTFTPRSNSSSFSSNRSTPSRPSANSSSMTRSGGGGSAIHLGGIR